MARVACTASILALLLAGCSGDENSRAEPRADTGQDAGATMTGRCTASPARCADFGAERPARLSEHAAAFDGDRGELIVIGGTDSVPEACALGGAVHYLDETWIYDEGCTGWQRVQAPGPSASGRQMAAYGDGNVWIFGGRFREDSSRGEYTLYNDLFRFEVATRSWHTVELTGERPAARVNGSLSWDAKRKRLWLFGGNTSQSGASYSPLADVWSFDPDAMQWSQEQPANAGPDPRLFHAALYDPKRDAIVVYGGADASAFSLDTRYFADLWSLQLNGLQWERLDADDSDAPGGRFWAGLVYDDVHDGYLLFGGHDAQALGNRNDSWRFDPNARSWTSLSSGDSYQNPAIGACMFPPDFAQVDLEAPERRSAHSLVWSPACHRALLFGGKTDCGAIDDVWSFEVDNDRWRPVLEATEGEACLRWREDPQTCGDLCF